MGANTKHFASLAGLMVVGMVALFLAFSPEFVKEGYLTLPQAVWIACGLTIVSFVCFLAEKILDIREQEQRDKDMQEILATVRRLEEQRATLSEAKLKQVIEAYNLYKALNESAGKRADTVRDMVEGVIKNAAGVLTVADFPGAASTGIFELAKKIFSNKLRQRNELRQTAELLTLSALGTSKQDSAS
jgi:hypothetical protein